MKNVSKALALILAALLFLASCGGNAPTPLTPTPEGQSGAPSTTGGVTTGDVTTGENAGPRTLESADLMREFTPRTVAEKALDASFVEAQTAFDLALFRRLLSEKDGQSVVISPFSVMLALAMTLNGADGKTEEEMLSLLGGGLSLDDLNVGLYHCLKDLNKDGALSFADAIFFADRADFNVLPEFLQTNADYYDAGAYRIPFDDSAVSLINDWVSGKTGGRVNKMIDKLSDNARMLLVNALCFDAEWEQGYAKDRQDEGVFHGRSGDAPITMMYSEEEFYIEKDGAVGFIKPYKNGYGFAALLPQEGMTTAEYIAALDARELSKMLTSPKKASVSAAMPRFSCDSGFLLNEALAALGMPTAFSREADFSKITGKDELYIGRVIHNCMISVDGMGTKAGAATAVEMLEKGIKTPEYRVTLDRPFVYIIFDSATGMPVFMGTLENA